jgi:diguanylate cyclase (GGDEF)-like protein
VSDTEGSIEARLLQNAFNWFVPQFRQTLVNAIESEFPDYPLPREIKEILDCSQPLLSEITGFQPGTLEALGHYLSKCKATNKQLFKQIIYRYRRDRAVLTERLTEKTFHPELASMLEKEVKTLDVLVNEEWFQQIGHLRLPRLKDFLPVQHIEAAIGKEATSPPRQYDEKFHILQAPQLFLADIAYFRTKCEARETPLAVAFLDIDDFKRFNTNHTEPKIDRNLLPRFMQVVEAHVFHHGYAYRQGGDEYLMLIPSMSKALATAFLDELRCKLAALQYPDIVGNATVSIGLCIVDPDCPFTDRELRDRASQAKKFAKEKGKNRIATYEGPRFTDAELRIVAPKE